MVYFERSEPRFYDEQVRNVPDEIHRALKVRAVEDGMTLSDYVLRQLEALVGQPTLAELGQRILAGPRSEIGDEAVRIIREARGPLP